MTAYLKSSAPGKVTLAIVVIFMATAPVNGVIAADKGNIPNPPVLSKDDPAPGSAPHTDLTLPLPGAGSSEKATDDRMLYWYDGQRKRMLSIDADTVADFGTGAQSPAAQPRMIKQATTELVKELANPKQAQPGLSPMFDDAASGRAAGALPGGVMVRTLRPLDQESVAGLAGAFGSSVVRAIGAQTAGVGDTHDFWLFDAPAGLPALELANRIHESGQVKSAAPNWWKPRQLK